MEAIKLTPAQVKDLRAFKYEKDGKMKFFEYIENVYADNLDVMKSIEYCKEMCMSVDDVDPVMYPAAHSKTENMYYDWMDELLNKIGYTAE